MTRRHGPSKLPSDYTGMPKELRVDKAAISAEEFGNFTATHATPKTTRTTTWVTVLISILIIATAAVRMLSMPSIVALEHGRGHVALQVVAIIIVAAIALVYIKIRLIRGFLRKRGR